MATTFPTSLQDLDPTRGTTGQPLSAPSHITHHANEDDTIEALQAKVGIDSSLVTTTHDYKLSGVTGSDKAASKAGSETLTNKTINGASNTLAIREADLSLIDITTADVSTTKHGFAPKIPNDATKFLNGIGTYTKPSLVRSAGVGSADVATNQTITIAHGLGTTPAYIKIIFLNNYLSGFDYMQVIYVNSAQTGIGQITEAGTSTNGGNVATARIYNNISGGATGTDVVINAPDATNISFTTTKFNTPSASTYVYQWEAWA